MQVEYRAGDNRASILPHMQKLMGIGKTAVSVPCNKEALRVNVSAVIITYNEEAIIAETLSHLWWCNEIVVIDSGSTDKTVQICEQYGCSVFTRPFTGFGEQKNYGVSKAKNDWVLCIDADEILSQGLIEEMATELNKTEIAYAAFSVPRNLVFMNKVFKYGKETNSSVIRLFNRQKGGWDGAVVHESVSIDGKIKQLHHKILHYSYHDYSQFLAKINLYSTLGAKKLLQKGSRKSKLVIILAIPFNFFRYYIIDRNFMNGFRGFAWAVLNTCYHFVKYLKLEELRK